MTDELKPLTTPGATRHVLSRGMEFTALDWRRLLCKIGLHDWGKPRAVYLGGSNVRDVEKRCRRCGKLKRWVEPVE